MPRRPANPTLLALAALAAIAGVTFALQGVGVPIGHSFMIGDLRWTAIGVVLVAAAALVGWAQLRRH